MNKNVKIIEPEINYVDADKKVLPQKRVCAYCRVSTDSEEQLKSCDAQENEFKKRISSNPDWEDAGVYIDKGISGTNAKKRPQFQLMLSACKAGKVDLILTKSISRFARNTIDCIKTVRELKAMGVEVYFEKENLHTMDEKAEFTLTILSSIAQEESHNISQNSKWGIRKRMKDGVALVNCNRFLGYDKDKDGNLVVNPEEAKIVQRIYNEYLNGKGCTKIAKDLERDGIATGSGQTKWCFSTVRGILENEKYYGKLLLQKTVTVDYLAHKRVDNKSIAPMYVIENNHKAIIPKEMWDRVQAERERRFALTSGKNSNKAKYVQRYPLSGKLVCANCGETLKRRHWNTGTPSERIVWQCITYINRQASFCPTKGVGETTVQAAFVEAYNRMIKDKTRFFNSFLKVISKTLEDGEKKSDFAKTCKKIEILEGEVSALIKMKLQKQIDDLHYNQEYQQRVLDIRALTQQRDKLMDSQISVAERNAKMEQIKTIIHDNSNPLTEFDPYLFETLIDKVIVHSPIEFTFIFQSGVEMDIDASKYNDGRKYKSRKY